MTEADNQPDPNEVDHVFEDFADRHYKQSPAEAEPGTIKEGEYHPAADSAMAWLKGYMVQHPIEYRWHKEALASTALSGNRLAEICMSTIERLANGEPVSDRYLLGLAWTIMKLANHDEMELTESMRIDQ
jgi:hypothetical protein